MNDQTFVFGIFSGLALLRPVEGEDFVANSGDGKESLDHRVEIARVSNIAQSNGTFFFALMLAKVLLEMGKEVKD